MKKVDLILIRLTAMEKQLNATNTTRMTTDAAMQTTDPEKTKITHDAASQLTDLIDTNTKY